ncbi:MAG: polymer-forming cytoskeletal protein [Acidobacteria bacterium]|nr:polymer-forming cytoskeletal protein [Acidobacteriota bacterium]
MIRMGRGNRPDNAPAENETQQPAPYAYATETQPVATRAISESDSMARDIKEGRLSGFVGHGTTLTGETVFHAMLRVDGHLIGTVSSDTGTLIVGTNGQVDANVSVAAAMINGSVNGDIFATEKLQLGRTARVIGNIQCPKLIVEDGAILEGNCTMLRARETAEEAATAPAVQYTPEPEPAEEEPFAAASDDLEDEASLLAGIDDESVGAAGA